MTTKLYRNHWRDQGLGRVRIPDARDREYTLPAVRAAHEILSQPIGEPSEPLPRERTQPWHLPTVRLDQGPRPTCTAFAVLNFLLAAPLMSIAPKDVEVWTEDAYLWSQDNDEWPGNEYDGTSVRAALQYLRKEHGGVASFARATSEAEMRRHLLSPLGGPLVIGVDMFENMAAIGTDGLGEASGEWLGGHAMLCYWYSKRRKQYDCLNQWSPEWGDNGILHLPEDSMIYLIEELGGDAYAPTQVRLLGEKLQSPFVR